jgi:uncharacterized protein YciI
MVKYVLLYESGPETASKAPLHVAEHRSRWREFQESGALLMIGPFTNPAFGAMGVFASSEAAHAFAEGDPFVVNGVVAGWHVREWNEVLTP